MFEAFDIVILDDDETCRFDAFGIDDDEIIKGDDSPTGVVGATCPNVASAEETAERSERRNVSHFK